MDRNRAIAFVIALSAFCAALVVAQSPPPWSQKLQADEPVRARFQTKLQQRLRFDVSLHKKGEMKLFQGENRTDRISREDNQQLSVT